MRISDWSSDVCSSDLYQKSLLGVFGFIDSELRAGARQNPRDDKSCAHTIVHHLLFRPTDRKSVVSGKSVSVRVDLGGRRLITKQPQSIHHFNSTYLIQHFTTSPTYLFLFFLFL